MPPELGPAPALLDPSRDQGLIATRGGAQLSRGPRSRLIESPLTGADQDARHLGQQIRAVAGYLAELRHRHGELGFGQGAPAGVALGDAGDPSHKQTVTVRSRTIMSHPPRIEHISDKDKLAWLVSVPSLAGKEPVMEGLTPASPDRLPPLGELIADNPFWRYPIGTAREEVTHLRVWLTSGPEPGHLAVVTETGTRAGVTESAGHIWAELAGRYGPSLVLLEHHLPPELSEGAETLDLVRIGADGSAHWLRVWPTPEENPRHAGLELWMAAYGHQVVSTPASWFDWCQDEDD
jgi:hypothetical protein